MSSPGQQPILGETGKAETEKGGGVKLLIMDT